jgi:hypothetical protein
MKSPQEPTFLGEQIGFGKYKTLSVQEIFTGSTISQEFIRLWIKELFKAALIPQRFSCSCIQYLNDDYLFYNTGFFSKSIIQKTLFSRWNKLPGADGSYWSENEDTFFDDFPESRRLNEDEFDNTLTISLTEKQCQFLSFDIVKNYIVLGVVHDEETWLNADNTNYLKLAKDILAEQLGDEEKDEKIQLSNSSPLPIEKCFFAPVENNEMSEYFLLFGTPSYIDWALRTTDRFFICEAELAELEKMNIIGYPTLKLEQVASDILKWELTRKSFQYKFSDEAKEKNAEKYKKYLSDLEDYDEYENDRFEARRSRPYTDQDYIDDAFGGDASAYWNID